MLVPVDRPRKQFEPCRNPNRFLYWRSKRDLPTGRWSRPFHRGTSPRQVLTKDIGGAGASWLLPANRLGPEDSVAQAVAYVGSTRAPSNVVIPTTVLSGFVPIP